MYDNYVQGKAWLSLTLFVGAALVAVSRTTDYRRMFFSLPSFLPSPRLPFSSLLLPLLRPFLPFFLLFLPFLSLSSITFFPPALLFLALSFFLSFLSLLPYLAPPLPPIPIPLTTLKTHPHPQTTGTTSCHLVSSAFRTLFIYFSYTQYYPSLPLNSPIAHIHLGSRKI